MMTVTKMKKWMGGLLASALVLGVAGTALAHDGWVQTSTPVVRVGETAYIDLMYGNHSNEHGSYKIAGKWNMASSKLYVIAPNGQKVDITSTVYDTGEATDVSPTGTKGFFTAGFVPGAPGAYILSVEGDSIFRSEASSSRTLRSAKTFVAAADLPLRERVAALTAFTRAIAPDRAELVPQVNPVALTAGTKVEFKLMHKGQPVANEHVTVIRRSNGEKTEYTTDANGVVAFLAGPADFYLARAKFAKTDEKKAGEYDLTNYEATVTFVVNRSAQAASGSAGLPISVWVNGAQLRLDANTGTARIVSDRTFLPLRAVGEALGATFNFDAATNTVTVVRGGTTIILPVGKSEATVNGRTVALDAPAFIENGRTMVPVRFIAETLGAHVDFMPAAFGVGAVVIVNQTN